MRARCLIDLGAIRHNVALLVEQAAPASVCAVVKADGYGHGALPTAAAALAGGATWLAVVSVEEALALRAGGVAAPLLVLLALADADLERAVSQEIDLGVGDPVTLAAIMRAAEGAGRSARVHLEVDTGLGRGGAPATAWAAFVAQAARAVADGTLQVVGVWSHLAFADVRAHPMTLAQRGAFDDALAVARRAGVRPLVRHLASSGAIFTDPSTRYDLVRPGIAVYGHSPGASVGTATTLGLRPAMTLTAEVALIKRVPARQGVSYGHRYRTAVETTLALVTIGYGDGVPRAAGAVAEVLIGGRRRTIAGTVCMDQFVVDMGDGEVAAGDEAVLFGPGDRGEPTVEEWAGWLGTIPNEIVTRVGPRVPRVYVDSTS